jgi:hypothetical protein
MSDDRKETALERAQRRWNAEPKRKEPPKFDALMRATRRKGGFREHIVLRHFGETPLSRRQREKIVEVLIDGLVDFERLAECLLKPALGLEVCDGHGVFLRSEESENQDMAIAYRRVCYLLGACRTRLRECYPEAWEEGRAVESLTSRCGWALKGAPRRKRASHG